MAPILYLPSVAYDPGSRFDDPAFVADLHANRLRFAWSWPNVLAMAVRDGAASVHLHPWRTNAAGDDMLSYIAGGTRYGLLPPDAESGRLLLADARRLAAPGPVARLLSWTAGGAVGRVRLAAASSESEWCVVCWGRGRLSGVEFLRLSPVPVAVPTCSPDAEPEPSCVLALVDS